MSVEVKIDPGICNFPVIISATSDDGVHVDIELMTECERDADIVVVHESGDAHRFLERLHVAVDVRIDGNPKAHGLGH